MHVSADRNGQHPRRGGLVLLVLTALLAVVAIASAGRVPFGSSHTSHASYELMDTIVSLLLVALVIGTVAFVAAYLYAVRAMTPAERAERVTTRGRRSVSIVAVAAFLLVALAVGTRIHRSHRPVPVNGSLSAPAGRTPPPRGHGYSPRFAPIPVAVVLTALSIAGLAAFLSYRSRRRPLDPLGGGLSALTLTLDDVLAETLDDLRAEPDPRKAVIAAYARLERTLAAFGLPRRASDAPEEYLRRILIDLEVGARHAVRLTQLFERAKFSPHRVGQEMKEEAIVLLEAIRADLQAAEAARAMAAAPPRPAGQPA